MEVVISMVVSGRASRQRRMTGIAEIPSPANSIQQTFQHQIVTPTRQLNLELRRSGEHGCNGIVQGLGLNFLALQCRIWSVQHHERMWK